MNKFDDSDDEGEDAVEIITRSSVGSGNHNPQLSEKMRELVNQALLDPRFRLLTENTSAPAFEPLVTFGIVLNNHVIAQLVIFYDDALADVLIKSHSRKEVASLDSAITYVVDTITNLRRVCDQKLYHVKAEAKKAKNDS